MGYYMIQPNSTIQVGKDVFFVRTLDGTTITLIYNADYLVDEVKLLIEDSQDINVDE